MIKYGKPSGPLFEHKRVFFKENDTKVAEFTRIAESYASQPRRTKCKNCLHTLKEIAFKKLGVEYMFCARCGHLNGAHEDTDEFCAALYTENGGSAYGAIYRSDDISAYRRRVRDIYTPKVEFLLAVMEEQDDFL